EAASIGVDVRHGGASTTVSTLDIGYGSEVQGRHEQEIEFETEDISTTEKLVYIRRSASKDKEWEDIQAIIEADEELAIRIQVEEREKYSKAGKARLLVDLISQRKIQFA
nr:hypothetical protein [Tanacetum cinerariifolium]